MTSLLTVIEGSVPSEKKTPTAVCIANPSYGIVGSVVTLDGRQSSDPDALPLQYTWEFIAVPIGSTVRQEGFRTITNDSVPGDSAVRPVVVSFSPDIVGEYQIGLTVTNGLFSSTQCSIRVSIRAILVPHGRGLVPDGKFIWNYIRDVWSQVDGKEWFETFWSALIQIAGSEMLKLYQNDFSKSIRDIQDLYQRRWISYEPKLELTASDLSFYIGNAAAGTDATSAGDNSGKAIIFSNNELIVTTGPVLPNVAGSSISILYDSMSPSNVGDYTLVGTNSSKNGYKIIPFSSVKPNPTPDKILSSVAFYFDFQSTNWGMLSTSTAFDYAEAMSESPSPMDFLIPLWSGILSSTGTEILSVGDVIHYPSGPNAGFYTIVAKAGTFVRVDKAPASYSDVAMSATYLANVYRPVGFKVAQADTALTNTFRIPTASGNLSPVAPGRVIIVNNEAVTVQRSIVDNSQLTPANIITTDGETLLSGLASMSWRLPNTLVSTSQNFEELGVSVGDLLVIDVTDVNAQTYTSVSAQVVGVSGFRLGFVITDEKLEDWIVPPVPDKTLISLASDLGIPTIKLDQSGNLIKLGNAAAIYSYLQTDAFQAAYGNLELTSSTSFSILGGVFQVTPRKIIRNSLLPVTETLKSIPILQDWISQPIVKQHDGKVFQVKGNTEYEIPNLPASLVENSDFIIDQGTVFDGYMTFATGSNLVLVEEGHFIDRGLRTGDLFEITSPVTIAGTYYIASVVTQQELRLSKPVPKYIIYDTVTAKVTITRKRTGHFLRFVPGVFSPKSPARDRYWAEVSFYDNRPTIESNFGILVGLTKADLESVSTTINYRQAVAGLMFAYTNGSAIDKVRLGAQILLGLPFSENRGIIRSIENDYRLDVHGVPVLGRILIEDVDSTDAPLGTQRVYTFPIDPISTLAGIETNPATGKNYAVGDVVNLFAALSKGVEVSDYLTESIGSAYSDTARLQQFHSIRLRANDSIFTVEEMGLVSEFLKRITPSYVSSIIVAQHETGDSVSMTDKVTQRVTSLGASLMDDASLNVPTAMSFNVQNFGPPMANWMEQPYWVRKSGKNLVTTTGATATLPGGVITPASGEGPVTREGDKLFITNGTNYGFYTISSVTDSSITVSDPPAYSGFQPGTQEYQIMRPLAGLIRSGTAVGTGTAIITAESGLAADGVASGDTISFADGTSLTILQVGPYPSVTSYGPLATTTQSYNILTTVSVSPTSTTYPALTTGQLLVSGNVSGTVAYKIYRPAFIESPYMANDTAITVSTSGDHSVLTVADGYIRSLLEVGDELLLENATCLRTTVIDPVALTFTTLPPGSYTARLCKKKSLHSVMSSDLKSIHDPFDRAVLQLKTSGVAFGSPRIA